MLIEFSLEIKTLRYYMLFLFLNLELNNLISVKSASFLAGDTVDSFFGGCCWRFIFFIVLRLCFAYTLSSLIQAQFIAFFAAYTATLGSSYDESIATILL